MMQMNSCLKNYLLLVFALTLLTFETSIAGFDDSKVQHIEYPDWFNRSLFFDFQDDLEEAKSKGRQGLMILFTTEGCSYCDMFIRKSLANPDIASIVQDNFDSLGVEIFDDTEMTDPHGISMSIKEFSKKEGVEFSPTLLFFDINGERVLRVAGYQAPERFQVILEYIVGEHYQHESINSYFSRISEKASTLVSYTSLKEDTIFERPPYALDRRHFSASQPLLVLFEEPGCLECQEFHNTVLSLKEVRDVLKKFEIVRLDVTDDETIILVPDGSRVTPKSWFNQEAFSRLPALLFFDEKGNVVLKTDALVLRQRMMNSLNYVLERAYEKDWSYQQFARSKAIERYKNKQDKTER